MANIIEIKNLKKIINNKLILKGVSLNIPQGSIFGLIGPNGAGKTTLIRHLLGLYKPTEGQILIMSNSERHIKNKIGFMLHATGLYPVLTCYQNLDLYATIYNLNNSEKKINNILKTVGLLNRKNDRVAELSKGMKQKLVLARALLHEPEILILDEPTVGLEIEMKVWFRNFIKTFVDDKLRTVIISSHELSELEKICTHVAIIRDGMIVKQYRKNELPTDVSLEDLYLKSGGEMS
ncbi:ABC transporter ATP-binding protein [Halothermothrix orenii]|uniref:ABC transporter related n=1 Tax=Halothermothrix orenii (strain H 168 / OCM 544 / DSM 9562) TaxID=373903 RepID=B8D1W5_HALOH|nr:ABC transporter ATP-binding protein [Halothermothrix orenii]ACL69192.1 ABC transporter related [Halothermothrix orenii H 168]